MTSVERLVPGDESRSMAPTFIGQWLMGRNARAVRCGRVGLGRLGRRGAAFRLSELPGPHAGT